MAIINLGGRVGGLVKVAISTTTAETFLIPSGAKYKLPEGSEQTALEDITVTFGPGTGYIKFKETTVEV